MLQQYEKLLARIVGFPVPTVAALNGHAVAAGVRPTLGHNLSSERLTGLF
jgi:enoyl-CoA hydratase/carnithine racemase